MNLGKLAKNADHQAPGGASKSVVWGEKGLVVCISAFLPHLSVERIIFHSFGALYMTSAFTGFKF